jgi:exodeoxyribonuclease-3
VPAEIKATPAQVPEPLTGLPGYASIWHGGPRGYSGVSLHVRAPASPPRFVVPELDVQNRVVELIDGNLHVLSVYVPNGNRDLPGKLAFLRGMREYVRGVHAAGGAIVLCGDLNVARTDLDVHPSMRGPRIIGQTPTERALLGDVLGEGLVDLGRAFAPDDPGLFTWWPPWRDERKKNHGWRLDFVLASTRLAAAATSCRVLADFGSSDHAPVQADLQVD